MFKKIVSLTLTILIFATVFSACSKSATSNENTDAGNDQQTVKEIRYLNFKPEIAEVYERISQEYQKETGIRLTVETAASGTYESTLTARMATDEAPVIFQINGPIGYASWADYCADLSDTELYKHLKDKSLAIESDGKVYG